MKIALCYDKVIPTQGGCETYIADLSRRLLADGHDVHLVASDWHERALPAGMQYHRVAPPSGVRFLRPWKFGSACLEVLKQFDHDVSVGFNKTWGQDVLYPQAGLFRASFDHNTDKFASVWLRRAYWFGKKFDLAHWSYLAMEKQQYLRARPPAIVVNSFMVRDHFARYYGVSAREIHVVRSAIDPDRFVAAERMQQRREARQRWGIAPNETVALFAAINYRLKGLECLLRAMQRLTRRGEFDRDRPLRLLVAGRRHNGRYRRLAERLGIGKHVVFAGHCPEMRECYFAADFFVHPTFYDPCSLVVLEALACGLPIITTKVNGASELITPGKEGYVIDDAHDHNQLAWCLAQMLDPARRAGCSYAAQQAASRWTFEHHYAALMDVFADVAASKKTLRFRAMQPAVFEEAAVAA